MSRLYRPAAILGTVALVWLTAQVTFTGLKRDAPRPVTEIRGKIFTPFYRVSRVVTEIRGRIETPPPPAPPVVATELRTHAVAPQPLITLLPPTGETPVPSPSRRGRVARPITGRKVKKPLHKKRAAVRIMTVASMSRPLKTGPARRSPPSPPSGRADPIRLFTNWSGRGSPSNWPQHGADRGRRRWSLDFLLSAGDGIGQAENRFQTEAVRVRLGYRLYRSSWVSLGFSLEGVVAKYLPSAGDKWFTRLGSGQGGDQVGREVGLVPGFVLRFRAGRFRPYIEAGSGVVYGDYDGGLTGLQSPGVNFRSHFGLGTDVKLWDGASLNLGFRYSHVSNAGLRDPNSGLDFIEYMGRVNISF